MLWKVLYFSQFIDMMYWIIYIIHYIHIIRIIRKLYNITIPAL